MDIKGLEACLRDGLKLSQTVEEYEFLTKLSSMVLNDLGDSQDDMSGNLLTDESLRTFDYIARDQGVILSSKATLDWYMSYNLLLSLTYKCTYIFNRSRIYFIIFPSCAFAFKKTI